MSFLSRFRDYGPLKYLMSKTTTGGASQRVQQEQLDMYRAAVLLRGHAWFEQNAVTEDNKRVYMQPNETDIQKFYSDVDCMSPKAIQSLVQRSVDTQIRNMFTKIDTYSTAVATAKARKHPSIAVEPYSTLLESLGFELECRESSVPNAGMGVFVKGEVCPGTVIALFPGIVHLAEYVSKAENMNKLLPDDDFHLLMRHDGHVIDSRGADDIQKNPFALGHRVNHVPQGTQPNVMQIPFDFPSDPLGLEDAFPEDLKKYVPYKFHAEKTFLGTNDRGSFMYGMIIIAAKPLSAGDELFVDYRLNPAGPVPDWYRPFDKAGAQRRWVDDNPSIGSLLVKEITEKEPFMKARPEL